jgi:hypothetical protein
MSLAAASCFNPIGFMPGGAKPDDAAIVTGPGDSGPGDISPPDNPQHHPGPGKGVFIFKNLSGGGKALPATFTVTGQEYPALNSSIVLGAGQEQSLTLLPGHYNITISFEGDGSPAAGSRALLDGRVEYVYFYWSKGGSYQGGINVSSDYVYGDIDFNYYQDNANSGDNGDGDNVAKPKEGDVSADNAPREKLPGAMRENYGIAVIHNLSASMPLAKVTFDHHVNDSAGSPDFDAHWEMNPGPDKGNRKSLILRPGTWKVRAIWIDPADTGCAGGAVSTAILKAGAGNHVNRLFFYKGTDGKYYLTAGPDSSAWSPAMDGADYLDREPGGGNGSGLNQEGQTTGENGNVSTGGSQWDPIRHTHGTAVVRNLSSRVQITKVTFIRDGAAGRKWEMGTIDARNNRSIILEQGLWHVTIDYAWGAHSAAMTLAAPLNVKAAGFSGHKTGVYFYYRDDGDNSWEIDADYHVQGGGVPPAYQDDGTSASGGAGDAEGDSPGVLTENNRKTLGLVVVKNLSKSAGIDDARFKQGTKNFPTQFMAIPRSGQRSILLGTGDWTYYLDYSADHNRTGRIPAGAAPSITVSAGSIHTLYFYQDHTGNYGVTGVWPPVWPALPPLADANADPAGSAEGFLHVKNASSNTILTKLSYRYGGTDTEMDFPGNLRLVPGAETANPIILPVGAGSVKLYNGVKRRWSGAIPVNIRERETFTVTYTDGMDNADLPSGYGKVKVTNKSSQAVQSVVFYDSVMRPRPEFFTLASGDTDSISVPLGIYLVQFKMESFMAEFNITLDNGSNRTVALTITDQTVAGKPITTNPNSPAGGIRVINSYPVNTASAAYLEMKIFKFHLFKVTIDSQTGNHTYGNIPDYTFDGTARNAPITRGLGETITAVAPGLYRLKITAGSYPWISYTSGIEVENLILGEDLITYDCGTVLILAGQERQYYFNNFNNEKDTPNGWVTFDITFSGSDNAFAMVHFEIAVRPVNTLSPGEFDEVYTKSWHAFTPRNSIREYSKWPGPWTGAARGPYAPRETVVFEWGGLLNSFSNRAGPFAIPPGLYWTRYNDNYGIGVARGSGDLHWRLIDLRKYGRRRVNCAADHTVGTNWAPVPQI